MTILKKTLYNSNYRKCGGILIKSSFRQLQCFSLVNSEVLLPPLGSYNPFEHKRNTLCPLFTVPQPPHTLGVSLHKSMRLRLPQILDLSDLHCFPRTPHQSSNMLCSGPSFQSTVREVLLALRFRAVVRS